MQERKTGKIHDIKETVSDAVEIIRQIGTPEGQESLKNVKETVSLVNNIIQSFKTPEMVKNIENVRLISENLSEYSKTMKSTMQQLKESGIIDESKELIKSVKGKINSFGEGNSLNGQDLREVSIATKEMFVALKELMVELKATVASTKKSETIHNVRETIDEATDIYKTFAKVN